MRGRFCDTVGQILERIVNSRSEKFVRTPLSQSSQISQTQCTLCGRIIAASANPDTLAIVESTHRCVASQMAVSLSKIGTS
jgi:hypothetical protein